MVGAQPFQFRHRPTLTSRPPEATCFSPDPDSGPSMTALRADGGLLQRELLTGREAAGLPRSVSALRVCDVVVWIRHRNDHRNRSCLPR
ncbi:DUF6308 family protein [Streptomyces sp. SD11]|uniref:DUF6308 family protein n=1 Tax=Streptomyces sp. SD11 TaxID=3452209 RepID=UPI003F8B13BD